MLISVFAIDVCTPFPNVAAHIVQVQAVGLLQPHRLGAAVTVVSIPGHRISGIAARKKFFPTAAAGCILPLSLCGQCKAEAFREANNVRNIYIITDGPIADIR